MNKLVRKNKNCYVLCGVLHSQICILSNGDFAFCCFDAEGNIGKNVKDVPILEAFYSRVFSDLREQHVYRGRQGTFCEKCSFSY